MSYQGDDGHGADPVRLYRSGDGPDLPVVYETDEVPPHCDVPVGELADALTEFLQIATRPTNLPWQSTSHSPHHRASERVKIPATSSSVTSRGAIVSRRCCFMVPATSSSTSPLS